MRPVRAGRRYAVPLVNPAHKSRPRTGYTALVVVPAVICVIVCTFGGVAYVLVNMLDVPARLGTPRAVRGLGVLVLIAGFGLLGWVTWYRKPLDVVLSTYVSMRKFVFRDRLDAPAARTEPLVLAGPQRVVRHPIYLAVVLLWLGWWMVLDYTLLLFLAFFFFAWFNLVVITFEERELRALYGKQYEAYMNTVPRFFPRRAGK